MLTHKCLNSHAPRYVIHLACDPTIWQPGFDLPQLCWTIFARNRDTAVPAEGNGDLQTYLPVSLCLHKEMATYRLTYLCPCGETQTMFHTVECCPLTKLNGGLSRLHSADEDVVLWLTNYGKWHAYEKKKKKTSYLLTKRHHSIQYRFRVRFYDWHVAGTKVMWWWAKAVASLINIHMSTGFNHGVLRMCTHQGRYVNLFI